MGNNLCCSDTTAEMYGNASQNISLKSFRKKALSIDGDFYVTIKEIQLKQSFYVESQDGLSPKFEGACVSLENQFGQTYQITKQLGQQTSFEKGKLVWDETFKVNSNLFGAQDTVTLKFLKKPDEDQYQFLNQNKPLEAIDFKQEHQTRSSTAAFTNAEMSFTEDTNVYGSSSIKVSSLAKSSYFSDWFKLMNQQNILIGKILVKTQFVKRAVPSPLPSKTQSVKKVCFDENEFEANNLEDSMSLNNTFQDTFKGDIRRSGSPTDPFYFTDEVRDSNSLSLAGRLSQRHKQVSQSIANLKKRLRGSDSPPEENEAENVAIKIRNDPKECTNIYVKKSKPPRKLISAYHKEVKDLQQQVFKNQINNNWEEEDIILS